MDSFLLGHAVQKNGPDLIRNLRQEEQDFPENVIHYLANYQEKPPECQDPELQEKICRFISKKADYLFISPSDHEEKTRKTDKEDIFAKMPPLETFMGIPQTECRKNFFNSIEKRDIVIGVVNSVMESGLVITLLCLDNSKSRDIDELRISAFCPVKELPKLFPNQDAIEGFQVRDKVRAVVLNVNAETEKLIVSMVERSLPEENSDIKLALITEDEFPVQFRRKLHIRGLTFEELLHSILGFNNTGNIDCLLDMLDQPENSSLMRGLHRLKIPEKDMAENLKKYQSQKMAHSSVAQGITYFKAGKQPEAIQCFNKALDIDKTNVEALVARGALYANNESFNRAIDDFEDALKINTNHANARKYLHDTLLAFGKAKEDIEKYQEAEELYTKAMCLEQSSVEAREALRFLHYRKSQRHYKETRRKSSPKIEKRSQSPEGFEKTAKTLKKLIKGEDKKHRKKRRRVSTDSSSSSSSSSSESFDSQSNPDRRRKRDSRSRDRSQRNISPPMDQQRQPVYGGGEDLPHQQYDVDLQASFMSGDGASFSDMFRSASQESDSTQGQKISTHISTIPVQYGADPYMYTNPQPNWYGMPGMDPAHMYGYGQQFPGYEQGFPLPPPMAFYHGNQIPCDNNARSRSRSSSRKRSRSDRRSRSSSFGRKRGQDSQQGESSGRKFTGRSSSPYDRRRSSTSQNRSLDNPSESPNYRRRDSREGRRSRRSLSHSWSGSPCSFEDSKRQADISEKRSPDREKRRSWSTGRRNSQDGRKQSVEEEGKIHEGGSSKKSKEKGKKVKKEDILSTSENTNKDISKNKQSSKSKKKKESEEEKGKVKRKKKDGGENRKKSKKSLDSEDKLNAKKLLNEVDGTIKKSLSGKGKNKVESAPDQMSVVSSSSEKKKSKENNDLEDVKVEDKMLHVTGDIRKIVHKEKVQDFSDSTIIAQQKANKETHGKLRKGHSLLDQLTKSKWDSPDELYNSPFMKYSSPLSTQIQVSSKDPYERLSKKGAGSSVDRNKRSNSREFEGIRIHITNDQYGKQTDKDNLGVVEMFHVDQQPRETNKLEESVKNTSSTKSIESKKKVSDNAEKVETNSAKEAVVDKSRTYRKRVSSPPSKSGSPARVRSKDRHSISKDRRSRSKHRHSRSKDRRSRSKHRWSRSRSKSPVHKRRSYSISPLRRNSGVGSSKKMRPLMKGRNKFTGSRSRSISPGRKYSGRLRSRSRSPQHNVSYQAHYNRGRESFRGSHYRGRASFKSFDGYRKSFESYRPQRSRSRSHTRRSRSKSPRYKGQRQDQGHGRGDVQHKSKSSTKSKQNNSSKIDSKTLDEIEDFYHQLKENKKNQKETEIQK